MAPLRLAPQHREDEAGALSEGIVKPGNTSLFFFNDVVVVIWWVVQRFTGESQPRLPAAYDSLALPHLVA